MAVTLSERQQCPIVCGALGQVIRETPDDIFEERRIRSRLPLVLDCDGNRLLLRGLHRYEPVHQISFSGYHALKVDCGPRVSEIRTQTFAAQRRGRS